MRTIKAGNIEIMEEDVSRGMSWGDAFKVCQEFGEGWRLPTQGELKYFYNLYKLGIGGFSEESDGKIILTYWSSQTPEGGVLGSTYGEWKIGFNIKANNIEFDQESSLNRVRPVRSL